MSPDSNPVKRFRSLTSGDADSTDTGKSETEQRGETPSSVPERPPLPSSYSSPTNNMSEAGSSSGQRQVSEPPGPPPWKATPVTREQRYEPEPQLQRQEPSAPVHYVVQNGPSPDTAFVIELIGGLLGFFGLGYMYAGETGSGVTRLLIGILCNVVVGVLAAITAGIFACLVLPIYIVIAILSASAVKKLLINRYQQTP